METIQQYGGFRLDRMELAKLFFILYNTPVNDEELDSGFGYAKIRHLKYYLKDFNLLDKDYAVTDLGRLVYKFDKYFEDEVTLWLFLYHWAGPSSNRFLYYHLNESLDPKTKDELRRDFIYWASNNNIKTEYKKDFVSGLIAITLNSYNDVDAFKRLNIFNILSEKYNRGNPYKTNPYLIAYVLYDNRQGRTTISFEELLKEPNNIGRIFNLTRDTLQHQIYAMRDVGLLQYVQAADLHHIVYTFQGEHLKLLEKYYE